MVPKEINNIIAQGEGYYTEFKRNINSDLKQEIEKAGLPKVIFHYNYFFAVEFTRVKSSEKSSEKILQLIYRNEKISAKEIADELGLTSRAIEKNIANLKKAGKIERVGSAKGGHWKIKDKQT